MESRGDFMSRILVVEDEENIRNLILYTLKSEKFEAKGLESSEGLYEIIKDFDLLILDIMLPGEDGFTILKKLRSDRLTKDIPIVILTAKDSEYHRIIGLNMGADDYLVKPFSLLELVARVRAVLRRYKKNEEKLNIVEAGPLTLITDRYEIYLNSTLLDLTYKEYQLLEYLIKNKNLVLTRNMIMEEIWGYDYSGESRTIDVHIRSLRQKLKTEEEIIETVRNLGYRLRV